MMVQTNVGVVIAGDRRSTLHGYSADAPFVDDETKVFKVNTFMALAMAGNVYLQYRDDGGVLQTFDAHKLAVDWLRAHDASGNMATFMEPLGDYLKEKFFAMLNATHQTRAPDQGIAVYLARWNTSEKYAQAAWIAIVDRPDSQGVSAVMPIDISRPIMLQYQKELGSGSKNIIFNSSDPVITPVMSSRSLPNESAAAAFSVKAIQLASAYLIRHYNDYYVGPTSDVAGINGRVGFHWLATPSPKSE